MKERKQLFITTIYCLSLTLSGNLKAKDALSGVNVPTLSPVITLSSMDIIRGDGRATLQGFDIKELPFASNLIGSEEIKRLKYTSPNDVLNRIPGQTTVRNLRIPRGDKAYTVTLIDDAMLGNPYNASVRNLVNNISVQDIERIDIFKGPVSALYPNNAMGGVINVISKGSQRMPEQQTRLWTEVGNFDRYRAGLGSQGEFQQIGYVFDYSTWNMDAYRGQAGINYLGQTSLRDADQERQQASVKFLLNPDEESSVIFHGAYLNNHSVRPGDLLQMEFDRDDRQAGSKLGSFSDNESFLGSVIYNRDITQQDRLKANFNFNYLDSSGVSIFGDSYDDITVDINGKLSLKHDFDLLDANIILGTDIFHSIEEDFNPHQLFRRQSFDYAATDIYAGFLQLQFSPIEHLQITAGVRHENIDLFHKNHLRTGRVTKNKASYSATLPKLGISYDFFDSHRLWFAYGQGFLAPTSEQLYTAAQGRANPDLNPEEAEHFEVGLRGTLPIFQQRLSYDISYYHQDIEQFIVVSRIPASPVRNTNAGKINIQGVESVLEYQPNDYIRLGLSHTYARNRFKQYIDVSGTDLSDEELSFSPAHHFNGRVAVMPIQGLSLELEVDSISSYTTVDNAARDPSGQFSRDDLVNLRVNYDKDNFELWFHALNIGNVKQNHVSYSMRDRSRLIRTVDGLQLYGGVAFKF